jgi:DNA replication and repair protein RecF
MPRAVPFESATMPDAAPRLWVERLTLTNFRNYKSATLELGPEPVVLAGANGSGKTNLLEAVSLLAPGQGLRRAAYADIARVPGDGSWSVAAKVHTDLGAVDIGTGLAAGAENAAGRIVRIDGVTKPGSGVLADYVEVAWLTPAMDGLFTGPASERRRFLDRLILCFDAEHGRRASRFERAMQQRNRLLSDEVRDNARFQGLEEVMAETGVAIAAARAEASAALQAISERRRERDQDSAFPWAKIAVEGSLEADIAAMAALDVEERYRAALRSGRERDRAAGRTLEGPHRSDLVVEHGPKAMPARLCSTGEQKALLLGLVLSHAELTAERQGGRAPILLLDEVTAHLDAARRAALFAEILAIGTQAWMTGTDAEAFSALQGRALFLSVDEGRAGVWPQG